MDPQAAEDLRRNSIPVVTVGAQLVRGITFLPQQLSAYVPHGTYEVGPQTIVDFRDRGQDRTAQGVPLRDILSGALWYVSPAAARQLQTEAAR